MNPFTFLSNPGDLTAFISIILSIVLMLTSIITLLNSVLSNIYAYLETKETGVGFVRFDLWIKNSGPATAKGVFWAITGRKSDSKKMETVIYGITPPLPPGPGIVVEGNLACGKNIRLTEEGEKGSLVKLDQFEEVSVWMCTHRSDWDAHDIPDEFRDDYRYSVYSFDPHDGHLIGVRYKKTKILPRT